MHAINTPEGRSPQNLHSRFYSWDDFRLRGELYNVLIASTSIIGGEHFSERIF